MTRATVAVSIWLIPFLWLTGCTGPWTLRGPHRESQSAHDDEQRDTARFKETLSDKDVTARDASRSETVGEPLPPLVGLDAQTDARVRDALWKLQRENPQGCKALKRILYEQDPSIPPLMAQGLREQCVAHLLAYSTTPGQLDAVRPVNSTAASPATALAAVAAAPQAPAATVTTPPALAKEVQSPLPSPAPIVPASAAQPSTTPTDTSNTAMVVPAVAESAPSAAATVKTANHEVADAGQPGEEFRPGRWASQIQEAITALEQELARVKHEEGEAARLNALLRLLYVVDSRREQAVKPIEEMTEDEREFWKQQLYGLSVSLDAEGMHAVNRRAALAYRYYDQAQSHLSNISTLDVRGLAFCSKVESFGRYDEFKSPDFRPGQEVLLYVEVAHFSTEAKGDQFETELQGEYEILDKQGVRIANVVLPRDKQLCNNRRRDYFIAYRLFIPKEITAGTYTLRLTIEDIKGRKSNHSSIDFKVRV